VRRRDFITLLSGATVVCACADTLAAQKLPMVRIGYLSTAPSPKECCLNSECISPSREAHKFPACWLNIDLHALGWREGENYRLDARHADNDHTILPRLAAELVALKPDILITPGTTETKALQAATSDIPIVFMESSDPVGMGIVDSLPRTGRNTTGTAIAPLALWRELRRSHSEGCATEGLAGVSVQLVPARDQPQSRTSNRSRRAALATCSRPRIDRMRGRLLLPADGPGAPAACDRWRQGCCWLWRPIEPLNHVSRDQQAIAPAGDRQRRHKLRNRNAISKIKTPASPVDGPT
jgi:ABC transporter substrate binding protein